MRLLTNNIVPGNQGRIFGTNATEPTDLSTIKKSILALRGIKDVIVNDRVYPREITVYSTIIVTIDKIESLVKSMGFQALPIEYGVL